MEMQNQIRYQYENVSSRLQKAAERSGRIPQNIRLLVVTKGQPVEKIQAAYETGARLFGENYPEETEDKIAILRNLPGIEFHMIGHLQSRKAKIVAAHFNCMHSIDRLSIAEKLNHELEIVDRKMPVLLEMNVGGEETKQGFPAWDRSMWDNLIEGLIPISKFSRLQIEGLMTMPPLSLNPEETRPYFAKLRTLRDFLMKHIPGQSWYELSMGTSSDYEVAIQEGATYIRVGSAIMGPRPSKNN
jgi:pyridoxal phosphate enzyme (YggS family)